MLVVIVCLCLGISDRDVKAQVEDAERRSRQCEVYKGQRKELLERLTRCDGDVERCGRCFEQLKGLVKP